MIGAPYVEPERYARKLNDLHLPGVYFRSCIFRPTFQKHGGVSCGGVQIHVTNRDEFEPVSAGLHMVKVAYDLYRDDFRWKEPPYEYVYDRNPFDVISGTSSIRQAIETGGTIGSLADSWRDGLDEFCEVRSRYLLY